MQHRHQEKLCIIVVFVDWMDSLKVFVTKVTLVPKSNYSMNSYILF